MVPIYAGDLACAVRDLEANLAPDAFRFGTADMAAALDRLSSGAFDADRNKSEDWMRETWMAVLRGPPQLSPEPPDPEPPGLEP